MRGILIDPVAETVTEIDVEPGLAGIRAPLQCQWIDIRSVGARNDLICDDEGRLVDGQRCFKLGADLLIAGRALLMSHNEEGETTASALPVDLVRQTVTFLPEGTDYTPPAPVVIGFNSWDMMKFMA